jgi:hypothetical protein
VEPRAAAERGSEVAGEGGRVGRHHEIDVGDGASEKDVPDRPSDEVERGAESPRGLAGRRDPAADVGSERVQAELVQGTAGRPPAHRIRS